MQEAVTKTISKQKKCKKAKWLSEKALQVAEKRRDMKGKKRKKKFYLIEIIARPFWIFSKYLVIFLIALFSIYKNHWEGLNEAS